MTGPALASALLALGLLAPAPDNTVPASRAEADAQVREALRAEALGRDGERRDHLQRAIQADPAHPTARALLGMLEVEGRWLTTDEAAARARADAQAAALQARYEARRARADETVDGQWRLALWCEAEGLKAEALAHLAAVTRLDPNHAPAWHRLGCRLQGGRWLTESQIAAEAAEATAQARADRDWKPRLAAWRAALRGDDPAQRAEAVRGLDAVRDPRAVPAIWLTFAEGNSAHQRWAVRLLDPIEAPAAAQALALLTETGRAEPIRNEALDALVRRDPRTYVGLLIDRLQVPPRVEVEAQVEGSGRPGVLVIEHPTYIERRIFDPARAVSDADPRPRPRNLVETRLGSDGDRVRFRLTEQIDRTSTTSEAIDATRRLMDSERRAVDAAAREADATNARIARALRLLTGRHLGPDRAAWTRWWTDRLGYSVEGPPASPKPVVARFARAVYTPPPRVATYTPVFRRILMRSCFGAGTPVLTRAGPRPIETIQIGDLVLTQDVTNGRLGYEPVVAVFHNPPAPTWRVQIGGEAITATGIHRFWRPGIGWEMARDLVPGDTLRTLGGVARVASVESDPDPRPVYNLEVARASTYFVGRSAALVHDNTLIPPTPYPFDAPAALAAGPDPAR